MRVGGRRGSCHLKYELLQFTLVMPGVGRGSNSSSQMGSSSLVLFLYLPENGTSHGENVTGSFVTMTRTSCTPALGCVVSWAFGVHILQGLFDSNKILHFIAIALTSLFVEITTCD